MPLAGQCKLGVFAVPDGRLLDRRRDAGLILRFLRLRQMGMWFIITCIGNRDVLQRSIHDQFYFRQ